MGVVSPSQFYSRLFSITPLRSINKLKYEEEQLSLFGEGTFNEK